MAEFALGYVRPADDDKTNHYKRDNDRCMKKRYGDERETKWKTEATNTSPEKNTKQKLDSIGIELQKLQCFRSFLGLGTQSFYEVDNCEC